MYSHVFECNTKIVLVSDKMYFLQYRDPFADDLFITTNNPPFYSFKNAPN